MAAAFDAQLQLYQQAQELPPSRVLACDRHPDQQVTGFCASCLRERLAGLDPPTHRLKPSPSSSGAPAAAAAAAAALKSLFSRLPGGQLNHHNAPATAAVATGPSGTALLPDLRRCKSFSGGRGAPPAVAFEPQRRSCDARRRGTLWSLFHLHEDGAVGTGGDPSQVFPPPIYYAASANAGEGEVEIEPPSLGLAGPVFETREEEDEEEEEHYSDAEAGEPEEQAGEGDEGTREESVHQELRPMKDHIDLDFQSKKAPPKDIAGGFWLAASVFGEKLRRWRRKHKEKKAGAGPAADPRDPPAGTAAAAGTIRDGRLPSRPRRLHRDAQSEVAEYAFGRRSCDTDHRFSLDAGRVSFDDPRYSWDEPRASWDGYLFGGGRQGFSRLPPMLSVIEDAPIAAAHPAQRSDGRIPVEEDAAAVPGGTAQTREYYSDSLSQRRRRSLDRSSSVRRPSFEAADEPLPAKGSSNSRVSPTATANEYFFHHVSRFDRDNRDSTKLNSLRDDCSESFESTYRDDRVGAKKSRRWSKAWSIWGLVHRRGHGNGAAAANVVERSLSESWPELRRAHSGKFFRTNSSVSSRNSFSHGNGNLALSSMRRNGVEMNGHTGMKRREEFVLERNRSARYSPSHAENGLLRFYLTPMSSSRRSKGPTKGWHKNTHPFTRSMLRLY